MVYFLICNVSRDSQAIEILYGNQRRFVQIVLQSTSATMSYEMHFCYNIVVGTFYLTNMRWYISKPWGWRDGLGVKSICCPRRGSGFGSLSAFMVAYKHR